MSILQTGEESEDIMVEKETGNRRYCRKCLTRDMIGQEEYFRSLREYIANLDSDIKASDALCEDRLAVCKGREMLLGGMRRSCGCYVELRAVIEKNICPKRKW